MRSRSRSRAKSLASSVNRSGQSWAQAFGVWCLAALRSIWRKRASPLPDEVGVVSLENHISVSSANSYHLALLIFVKVRPSMDGGVCEPAG